MNISKNFTCPYCGGLGTVGYISGMAMSSIQPLRCDSCSIELWIDSYDPYIDHSAPINKTFNDLEAALNACDCGGSFKFCAPARCVHCEHIITQDDITAQNLKGYLYGKVIKIPFSDSDVFYRYWKYRKPWGLEGKATTYFGH